MEFSDPTSFFIVTKLIDEAYHLRPCLDSRFPITVAILDQIIHSVQYTTDNMYDQCLYRAIFLFAFNAFARVGELTAQGNNVLLLRDIEFQGDKLNPSVTVTFTKFEHNVIGRPHRINFHAGLAEALVV